MLRDPIQQQHGAFCIRLPKSRIMVSDIGYTAFYMGALVRVTLTGGGASLRKKGHMAFDFKFQLFSWLAAL